MLLIGLEPRISGVESDPLALSSVYSIENGLCSFLKVWIRMHHNNFCRAISLNQQQGSVYDLFDAMFCLLFPHGTWVINSWQSLYLDSQEGTKNCSSRHR